MMNELTTFLCLFTSLSFAPPTPNQLALVKQLSHDDYPVRQKAHDTLFLYGMGAREALYLGMQSNDLETKRRCERLWDEAVGKELHTYVDKDGKYPWIDSLWMVDATEGNISYAPSREDSYQGFLNRTYSKYFDLAYGCCNEPWDNYRVATRWMVRDWIILGVPRWWIEGTLKHMRDNDKKWQARMDGKVNDPEVVPPPVPAPMPPPPPN